MSKAFELLNITLASVLVLASIPRSGGPGTGGGGETTPPDWERP